MKNYMSFIGYLGNAGTHSDPEKNKKFAKIQEYVNRHNNLINTFETEIVNEFFHKAIMLRIKNIMKTI